MPISTPAGYSRELAEETGLFYTQGLPDDTSALENGFFDDDDFVQQSDLVMKERLAQLEFRTRPLRGARARTALLLLQLAGPDLPHDLAQHGPRIARPTPTADPAHAGRIREVYRNLDARAGRGARPRRPRRRWSWS